MSSILLLIINILALLRINDFPKHDFMRLVRGLNVMGHYLRIISTFSLLLSSFTVLVITKIHFTNKVLNNSWDKSAS